MVGPVRHDQRHDGTADISRQTNRDLGGILRRPQAAFFDGSAPHLGRCFVILVNNEPVGQVYYNDIEERDHKKRTELDVWLRSERYCGQGFGSDAILTLCEYLAHQFGVQEFMMQPSARNPRAIRAYEKIGFVKLPLTVEEARARWGPNDYFDSVYMVKTVLLDENARKDTGVG